MPSTKTRLKQVHSLGSGSIARQTGDPLGELIHQEFELSYIATSRLSMAVHFLSLNFLSDTPSDKK